MPLFLCIETSTEVCSVSLGTEDGILYLSEIERKNSHTETITLQIQECIDNSGIKITDLSCVGISDGPGSYTGLRVGTTAAKGICFGLKIPLVKISTLYGLAYGLKSKLNDGDLIMPMIDARRMEVYTALFDHRLVMIKEPYNLILNDETLSMLPQKARIVFCGNGSHKASALKLPDNIVIIENKCSASYLHQECVSRFNKNLIENTAKYEPFYYKSPNVTKSKKGKLPN